jgi:hypothetical protein
MYTDEKLLRLHIGAIESFEVVPRASTRPERTALQTGTTVGGSEM